jgi:hypothetical protein
LNTRDYIALLGIFDVGGQRIEYVGCVEEKDPQYCQYP